MGTLRDRVIRLAYSEVALREPLLHVLAARPIRIERAVVERVLDNIYMVLEGEARDNPKEPAGETRRGKEVATDTIILKDVRGEAKVVLVVVAVKDHRGGPAVLGGGFGYVGHGPLEGSPVVMLELNGTFDWETLADQKSTRDRLRSVLMHELTHASDIVRNEAAGYVKQKRAPNEVLTDDDVDLRAYFNDPHEVRAFMRELYEKVGPTVRKVLVTNLGREWGLGGTILRSLKLADLWKRMEPHLTRQNKNRILKGLVTAFEDEGLS